MTWIVVSETLLWAIVRCGLAIILCSIVGGWLGKLTGGLTPNERLQVRIAGLLLLGAGLLLPAP